MANRKPYIAGFTIVELLIVIVVIGILAAITIVAFNGIQDRARVAALHSDLRQAVSALEVFKGDNGAYPADASALSVSPDATYAYSTTSGDMAYCLAATGAGNDAPSYHVSSVGKRIKVGSCTAGHWTLTGGASDSSMYSNNGTVSGATLTVDKNGRTDGAYSFNGTSDYVSLPSSLTLPMAAGTLSAWVLLEDTGAPQNIIFYGSASEDGCTGYPAIALSTCGFVVQGDDGVISVPVPTITDSQWHHVVGAWDSASGTAKVYVDGALRESRSLSFTPTLTQTVRYIGRPGANSRFVSGSIDDVSIYSKALSTRDIKMLYDQGPQ